MNKTTLNKIAWNRTLQNFSLAIVLCLYLDIAVLCTYIHLTKAQDTLTAEDILNTPDLSIYLKD